MKTEVILQRSFMGSFVEQKSKSGMFNATSLIKVANIKRRELNKANFNLTQYLKQKATIEFIEELQKDNARVIIKGRGRNSQTWVHPLLFIDVALQIDPKFKIEVYKWLFDELIKYRNDSGESYKKMAGALYENITNKREFHAYIQRVANFIKKECNVEDWNRATKEQLFLRDKMHENVYLLCSVLKGTDQSVRIGVKKAKQDNIDLIN